MAKRKLTYDDYTPSQFEDYSGEDPPVNKWFTFEIESIKPTDDDEGLRLIFKIVDHEDYAGWPGFLYGNFDGNTKWKLQEAFRALRGGDEKDLEIDWDSEKAVAAFMKKCKRVRGKTREYNDRITLGKVTPLLEAVGGGKGKPATEPEPDPEEDLEPYTESELKEMTLAELRKIMLEEFGATKAEAAGVKRVSAAAAWILEAQEEEGDEEEPEADDAEEDDDEFEELPDDEDEDDEEEEPEPEPAPRARRAAKKAAPAATKATTTRRRRG